MKKFDQFIKEHDSKPFKQVINPLQDYIDITFEVRALFREKYTKHGFSSLRFSEIRHTSDHYEANEHGAKTGDIMISFTLNFDGLNGGKDQLVESFDRLKQELKAKEKMIKIVEQIAFDYNAYHIFHRKDDSNPTFVLYCHKEDLENHEDLLPLINMNKSKSGINKYNL